MVEAYAGPLSRWFSKGDEAEAVRLRAGVEQWREDLRSSVAEKVSEQLAWDEASACDDRFDLGEAGWSGLRLFAFYAERSDLEWPDTVPSLLELDADWRKASDEKFGKSLYGQILACDLWLPGEFPVTVRAPRPDGAAAELGSLKVLSDQLLWLNQRTFQADQDAIAGWRGQPAPAGAPLLQAARRGYAMLAAACARASEANVPLLIQSV
ncbi:MAG: hypothetical protein VX044_00455 [Planctomycetota bacterium]|nr:hypothetical protein [Planctomycetota bacterium]